jgi:acyl-CoA synthetase (NDP forming)
MTAAMIDPVLSAAAAEGRSVLLEHEVYALLAAECIGVPRHRLVPDAEAVDAALVEAIGSAEAVVKIASPEILHKSDVGGVVFARNEPAALREAVARVVGSARRSSPGAPIAGALVVEKVAFRAGLGRELLAGFRHDPAFGPIVVLGVGGLDTEYLLGALRSEKARALLAAEGLDEERALAALRGTLAHAALTGGLRGGREGGVPEGALAALAVSLGRLAVRLSGFAPGGGVGLGELELNPVVADASGRFVALDGLARLHRPDPVATPRPVAELERLLQPKSAVVIGASAEGMNVGRVILRNLIAGGGIPKQRLYAIHPRADAIDGCRAVPTAAELPEAPLDMAVVAVAADKGGDRVVLDLVENRRARSVTLISGGFGETEGGREAEARLRAAIERAHAAPGGGVLVNGGNCLGIVSEPGAYNTFFIPDYKMPLGEGTGRSVASISQSGAYLVTQFSNQLGAIRPRYAISFGNQMDVTVSDYLEYLERDKEARVFSVYLEGFRRGDGARFLEAARRLRRQGRAVLLYKAGRSSEGRAAAASHTAAAVGDYEVCRDLARQAGVVVCDTLDDFDDALVTFAFLEGRPPRGTRLGILSNAGFECTAAADRLHGMTLAELAPATIERLRGLLPAGVVDVHNPIDATPTTTTDRYVACARTLFEDPGVDAVVVAGVPATPAIESLAPGPGHAEDIARETSLPSRLVQLFRQTDKPVVFSVDSGRLYDPCVLAMKQAGLPVFRKVDRALRGLATYLSAC